MARRSRVRLADGGRAKDAHDGVAVKTFHAELLFVALVLAVAGYFSGAGWVEAIGACAVLASFAHAQVSDRLAEHARLTDRFAANMNGHLGCPAPGTAHHAYCWRWSLRYFVTKEALWLVYFVAHRSWSALVGVFVFLLYPVWRRAHRRGRA